MQNQGPGDRKLTRWTAELSDKDTELVDLQSAGNYSYVDQYLNQALVERSVPVESLVPVRSTLEDVFLEVTR